MKEIREHMVYGDLAMMTPFLIDYYFVKSLTFLLIRTGLFII
jgi:hypothetical protein